MQMTNAIISGKFKLQTILQRKRKLLSFLIVANKIKENVLITKSQIETKLIYFLKLLTH